MFRRLNLNSTTKLLYLSIGYASSCRIGREDEEKRLQKEIDQMKDELSTYPPLEHLQQEYMQLKRNVQDIKEVMNISGDSDESPSDVSVIDDIKEEIGDDEEDYTSSDDEIDE